MCGLNRKQAGGCVEEKCPLLLLLLLLLLVTTICAGALFDVRARHLTDAFQSAVDQHNRDEQERKGSRHRHHDVESLDNRRGDIISIIFDPVITFVDVTDSFAVSNASKIILFVCVRC